MPFILAPIFFVLALIVFGVSAVVGFVFNILIGVIVAGILGLIFAIFLYILPSIIAYRRRHGSREAILALNLLAGWTLVGWVAAFVWAFVDGVEFEKPLAARITELESLKNAGKITAEEFETLRKKALGL